MEQVNEVREGVSEIRRASGKEPRRLVPAAGWYVIGNCGEEGNVWTCRIAGVRGTLFFT